MEGVVNVDKFCGANWLVRPPEAIASLFTNGEERSMCLIIAYLLLPKMGPLWLFEVVLFRDNDINGVLFGQIWWCTTAAK